MRDDKKMLHLLISVVIANSYLRESDSQNKCDRSEEIKGII